MVEPAQSGPGANLFVLRFLPSLRRYYAILHILLICGWQRYLSGHLAFDVQQFTDTLATTSNGEAIAELSRITLAEHVLNNASVLDLTFQALSDPTRRAIVERLAQGPASVSDLAAPIPMSMPAVLQHLAVLENCGLVASRKVGRVRTCRIEAQALSRAESWLTERHAEWAQRLVRLNTSLNEIEISQRQGLPTPQSSSAA